MTVVTLYHVDNVFGVAVNAMINKSSFVSRTKCIISKSVVYVVHVKQLLPQRKEPRCALAAVDGLCSLALTNIL